jgi:TRAP-type C4-dicarboxylate transport system permease small subunit
MLAVSVTNIGMRSIWFPIALAVMQAWAGFELVRMSPQSRGIATLYGVVALATTIYISYPALELMQRASGLQSKTDALAIGAAMFALVLPIATLVLVHRTITPTARARFRKVKPAA